MTMFIIFCVSIGLHPGFACYYAARIQPIGETTMDWKALSDRILDGGKINEKEALAILQSKDDELLEVLQGA